MIQNVKLSVTKKEGAVLYATDPQHSIRFPLDCEVQSTGKAVLPLADLLTLLRATKEKSLTLFAVCSAKTARIDVTGEQEKYALEAPASADEFPDVIPFQSAS